MQPRAAQDPAVLHEQQLADYRQAFNQELSLQLIQLEQRLAQQNQTTRQQVSRLDKKVASLHEENLRFHRQHTYQIEELSQQRNLSADPGFNSSKVTEVVQEDGKLLLGRYEWVSLPAQQLTLPARVDSGANTSSLHAVNLREFERDGKSWVGFETHYQPRNNEPPLKAEIEAPIIRRVRIIQASGTEARPVVSLPMKLGSLVQDIEFTLSDRGDLTFPILLGRRFMMDIAVIDVSRTYVQGKPVATVIDPEVDDQAEEADL
ncbi:ATP-dependent zinc protease [Marinospirillum sp.]|uniref:ATP-dependent zinc protease family protein n=1 Tax=Marinospirillum sp. TaxID=2183934 RepID=UPI0025C693F4|nr:ATP-dependent zinc protease [Marinospirillum sp.]